MKSLAKKIIVIFILTIMVVNSFNFMPFINKVNADTNVENQVIMENNHYKYFYFQLSQEAKNIYDAMIDMYETGMLKTGNANYDLVEKGKVSEELVNSYKKGDNSLIIAFENARDAFYLDYPEVFFINIEKYSLRITSDSQGKAHVWLGTGKNDSYYLSGFTNIDSVNTAESEYISALNTIVNGAKALREKYSNEELIVEQIKYVHNEVAKSTSYKLDDKCKSENKGHIRTPYGALVAKEAVCEGYSKAVKVALDKLEIPSILVRGVYKYGNDIERHMWNYVQINGKWYAVDSTFDDEDKRNQIGEIEIYEDYLLVGESKMSIGHNPDGIMSAPEFEFKYPKLEYDSYGVKEIANINGLEVKYKAVPYQGNTYVALDISYKGMNFEDCKKAGYHFLTRYYSELNNPQENWGYVDTKLYPSMLEDGEKSFQLNVFSIPYVEIAVVDIKIDDRAYNEDFNIAKKYLWFQGDESNFLASSGILEMPDATYVQPPRFTSAVPYVDSKLKAGKTTHIKITYNEDLEKTTETFTPSCYITTKNAWTNSAQINSCISNFTWDGTRTIQFDFTPSSQYGDNSVIYYFNIEGLVGKESKKIPTPAYYYVQNSFGCTYSMAKANAWRIYGRPTLIENGTSSVEGWTLSDGQKISKEDSDKLKNITDRLALVVDKTTLEETEKMNDLISQKTNAKVLSSETYNINLILCNKKVLSIANNDKVTVYLGFPEGYGPNDAGVTFKAYHFKTQNGIPTEVEEIPCVITPYGLLITCNAFSPFELVAFESDEENLEKNIVVASDINGTIENLDNNIISLNTGETKEITVKANDGYQIDSLTVLGKNVIEAVGTEQYDITISYDDIVDVNNIINATFVSKTIIQKETSRGETILKPTIEPAKITDMPKKIIAKDGEKAVISPKIENSNGIDTYQWYKDGTELIGETKSTLTIENVTLEDEGDYTLKVTSTIDTLSENIESTSCKILTKDLELEEPENIFNLKKYEKDDENKIISRVLPNTTVIDFMKSVETNQPVIFTNKKGTPLSENDTLTTASKINIGTDLKYTIVVTGDIDEDGKIGINDFAQLKLHFINSKPLTGINLKAADIDGVGGITINDVAQLKLVLIDEFEIK